MPSATDALDVVVSRRPWDATEARIAGSSGSGAAR